jgi:hypothetical protein
MAEEAYHRYSIQANQKTTHLAMFRTMAQKYPHKDVRDILRDLVASPRGMKASGLLRPNPQGSIARLSTWPTERPVIPRRSLGRRGIWRRQSRDLPSRPAWRRFGGWL